MQGSRLPATNRQLTKRFSAPLASILPLLLATAIASGCASEHQDESLDSIDAKFIGVPPLTFFPIVVRWVQHQFERADWLESLENAALEELEVLRQKVRSPNFPGDSEALTNASREQGEHFANHFVIGNFINEGDEKLRFGCDYLWDEYTSNAAVLTEALTFIEAMRDLQNLGQMPVEVYVLRSETAELYDFLVQAAQSFLSEGRSPAEQGILAITEDAVTIKPKTLVDTAKSFIAVTTFYDAAGKTSGCSSFL